MEPPAETEQPPSDPWAALDFTEFNQRLAEMGPDVEYDFNYIPWEQLAPYNLVGGEGAAAFTIFEQSVHRGRVPLPDDFAGIAVGIFSSRWRRNFSAEGGDRSGAGAKAVARGSPSSG